MPDHTHRIININPLFPAVAVAIVFGAIGTTNAQQFVEETASRFPSPNPVDYSNQCSIADIDNDGDLDLVFANGGNFVGQGPAQVVRVFVNDGNGVFTDETDIRTAGITGNFRGLEFGDIEQDGDLDMILAEDYNNQPQLLLNDGKGVFTDVTAQRLPAVTMSATRAQFGDIDNDGDLDIYINSGGPVNRFGCGQNRIFMNDGNGFFTDETNDRHPIGDVCEPMDVIFGDIDNDYDLDIRTANLGFDNSKIYQNDGTGVFADISDNAPNDNNCYSYDFGDINGDGNLDLLGANAGNSNTELLLEGDGTGSFTNASSQLAPNPTADDNDSKFFDLDNDGDLDLIVAALFQGREKIYTNDGNGNFSLNVTAITAANDASLDVMVADLDGDGDLDIVTAQGESGNFQNRIYINNGSADKIAPEIERFEQLEDTDDTAGPYVVRAVVTDQMTSDRNFFDKGVELLYSVDGGREMSLPMMYSGGQVYRGEIPGISGGTIVYRIRATDYNDNVGTSQAAVFTVESGGTLGDLDGSGTVNGNDLLILLNAWGQPGETDLDNSGTTGGSDLLILLNNWG